ncbi:hypothetical protein KSP40_PGU016122 [Platanthera guangdongensis]|uniref:Uncharacterized protein n=1 Tax=Platanthera guangdongensis TaxID=2320717 RepID=A0ABR2MD31_9ASPA
MNFRFRARSTRLVCEQGRRKRQRKAMPEEVDSEDFSEEVHNKEEKHGRRRRTWSGIRKNFTTKSVWRDGRINNSTPLCKRPAKQSLRLRFCSFSPSKPAPRKTASNGQTVKLLSNVEKLKVAFGPAYRGLFALSRHTQPAANQGGEGRAAILSREPRPLTLQCGEAGTPPEDRRAWSPISNNRPKHPQCPPYNTEPCVARPRSHIRLPRPRGECFGGGSVGRGRGGERRRRIRRFRCFEFRVKPAESELMRR